MTKPAADVSLLLEDSSKEDTEKYIKNILLKDLPASDIGKLDKELQWNFYLKGKNKKEPKVRRKKKIIFTRKQRKELDLLKLPKGGWDYEKLEPMRELWLNYMQNNLDTMKAPKYEDPGFLNFHVLLGKTEFEGAEVSVIKSKVASLVGVTGTIVLDTKCSFQIVTPKSELKTLLKTPSVFQFRVNQMKFTIFGKYMTRQPKERTKKTNKSLFIPEL